MKKKNDPNIIFRIKIVDSKTVYKYEFLGQIFVCYALISIYTSQIHNRFPPIFMILYFKDN